MKDYFGNQLNIGDEVAFYAPGYRMFTTGTIIKFTEKQVRVEYVNTWNYGPKGSTMTYLAYPNMFIKKVKEKQKGKPNIVSWEEAASMGEEYQEVLEREFFHPLHIDEHGTLRWFPDPDREQEIMKQFGASDLNDLFGRCRADKNTDIIHELYKCMGYSLFGFWEVFYWEANNENANEYKGRLGEK